MTPTIIKERNEAHLKQPMDLIDGGVTENVVNVRLKAVFVGEGKIECLGQARACRERVLNRKRGRIIENCNWNAANAQTDYVLEKSFPPVPLL